MGPFKNQNFTTVTAQTCSGNNINNINIPTGKDRTGQPFYSRYLTLHKFGGVYFDHDIISVREIPYEGNFLSVERMHILATAVFGLEKEHTLLTNSLKILVSQLTVSLLKSYYLNFKLWSYFFVLFRAAVLMGLTGFGMGLVLLLQQ